MTVIPFPKTPVHKQRLYPKGLKCKDHHLWDAYIEKKKTAYETPTRKNFQAYCDAVRVLKESLV